MDFQVSGSREREFRGTEMLMVVSAMDGLVRAAGTAGLGAGTERLIDDGLDGARAAAAFGVAAEAAIELLGIARQIPGRLNGAADIMVTQNVAGTNDHEAGRSNSDADP